MQEVVEEPPASTILVIRVGSVKRAPDAQVRWRADKSIARPQIDRVGAERTRRLRDEGKSVGGIVVPVNALEALHRRAAIGACSRSR